MNGPKKSIRFDDDDDSGPVQNLPTSPEVKVDTSGLQPAIDGRALTIKAKPNEAFG